MYKYDLKITIFSDDEKLEEIAREIAPFPNYTHNVSRYNGFSRTLMQLSDIAVIETDEFDDLYYEIDPEVKCIFVANRFKEKYSMFSSVIERPINYAQFKYEFIKLLEKISLEDQYKYVSNVLNTTINGMPDMFWVKSLDGIHTLLNDKFCEIVDKPKEDITGKDHYYIWNVSKDDPESGADICKQTEDAVITKRSTLSFYETVKSKKGVRQLVTYKSPVCDKNGKIIGTVGIGHDITDLKNLGIENQIILDSVPYAVLITDENDVVQYINNYFEEYFGQTEDDIFEQDYETWVNYTFKTRTEGKEDDLKEGIFVLNDEVKQVEMRFKDIKNAFGEYSGKICIFRDITKERELQKQLEESSNVDALTGLYNRRYLRNFVSNMNTGDILTLFSIDLDKFKNINDTYGHSKGDEALKITAQVLQEVFNEDLVVRMGGDEFLVVKTDVEDEETLKLRAEHLLTSLLTRFHDDEELVQLSSSIGVAQGVYVEKEFSKLVKRSDDALYQAKENGRSCFVVDMGKEEKVKKLANKKDEN